MSHEHVAALRSVPIFAGVTDEGIALIADIATEFEVQSGHVFIERGQGAEGCFVILDGTARVDLPGGGSVERGSGEFFGELSVLAESVRSARVIAASDMTCLAIRRDDLLSLIEQEPAIAIALLKAVAARFVESV